MADELIENEQDTAVETAETPAEIAVAVADEDPAVAGDPAAEPAAEPAAAPVNENFKWYIIHAYSGLSAR
jgi:transcriptional antiterminator NusG